MTSLRNIPSVHDLLQAPPLAALVAEIGHSAVADGVRRALDELRARLRAGGPSEPLETAAFAVRLAASLREADAPPLRPVINATGILLHTGLGRAPLCEAAIAELVACARDYASVELHLPTGERSQRMDAVNGLLCELTGAEAACVVNNNAGATLLALAALAAGKEVVVSRGELIEIGGSFRLPEVMAAGGATLREVGTTNKTHLRDYEQAIGEQTAALMQVHPSNYVVAGFHSVPDLAELAALCRSRGLPLIHDIGSGALIDFAEFGLRAEPVATESLRRGADLVLFSGDKLLGGPQAGIALGRADLVERLRRHPLARALRVDKLTLAALSATLRLYRDGERLRRELPLLSLLGTPLGDLQRRAETLAARLAPAAVVADAEAAPDTAYLGGGSVPTQELPTWCVAVTPRGVRVDALAAALRRGAPALVGRIQRDRLLLDLKTVFPRQDADIAARFAALTLTGAP